jgi:ABC-type arginine transport system permease subunit
MVQLVAYPLVVVFIFCFGGGQTALNDAPRQIVTKLKRGSKLKQFNKSKMSCAIHGIAFIQASRVHRVFKSTLLVGVGVGIYIIGRVM